MNAAPLHDALAAARRTDGPARAAAAAAVNAAMEAVLNSGRVTADLKPKGTPATTSEVGDAVANAI